VASALRALTGREDTGAGRLLRRHIDDLLAGSKQPHRDVVADPVAALDRPDPVLDRLLDPVDVIGHQAHESISGGRTLMPLSGMAAYRCTLIAAVRHGGIPLHGHAALRAATLARSCRTEGGYARPVMPH